MVIPGVIGNILLSRINIPLIGMIVKLTKLNISDEQITAIKGIADVIVESNPDATINDLLADGQILSLISSYAAQVGQNRTNNTSDAEKFRHIGCKCPACGYVYELEAFAPKLFKRNQNV